jgi:SPP1 Gp6-like portal protein
MARSALAPRGGRITLPELLKQAVTGDKYESDSIDDILTGLKQLEAQREVAAEADRYYEGDVGMVYASARVRQLLERQGVEHLKDFNYAKIPVDVVANRLQISGVRAAPSDDIENDEGTEDARVEAANKLIASIRKRNQLDAEEKRLHHDVSKHGNCFLLVWPVVEGGKVVDVDMRVNSAHHVTIVYDPEDELLALYAIKEWTVEPEGQPIHRVNLYYFDEQDGRIERWSTEPGGNPQERDAWFKLVDVPDLDANEFEAAAADEFDDDSGEDIPNPWGKIWFHFRNNRPMGLPEHASAYGPQQLINKLIDAHAGTIDYQSFPQRYQLVDPLVDDPLQNVSDPDHPDDDDDDPETESGGSGLRSDPGTVWRLWGKAVGQFTAADPGVFLQPLDRYIKSMAELTDTPQHAFSKASGDLPSGEAARELNAPTTTKVTDRQDRYDPEWEDSYELALRMLGVTGVSVDVRWKPQQMVNDLAGWQVVGAKIAAGVPPKVALEEAGYAPEQVEEWLKDADGADLGRRIALLNQIATAVQLFGAGVATGAVSAPQVQALISGVLKLTMEGAEVALPAPKPGDFVDPQAALKAQQEAQDSQQTHQKELATSQQDHQRTMAQEAAERAKELFKQGAGAVAQPNGVRPRRGGGRQR